MGKWSPGTTDLEREGERERARLGLLLQSYGVCVGGLGG